MKEALLFQILSKPCLPPQHKFSGDCGYERKFQKTKFVGGCGLPQNYLKGQSGIEYLTTYGWAIFALLIIIGIIVSSGVLTPNYLVSEECNFGNNLKCDFYLINNEATGHSEITIRIFNGFPYTVYLEDFELRTEDGAQAFSGLSPNQELESGESLTVTGILAGPEVPESAVKRFVGNITYYSCAPELGPDCSTVSHLITGRIVARVTPND
jgi:hypothetical protein